MIWRNNKVSNEEFEIVLGNYYYTEQDKVYKKCYEQFAIINRVINGVERETTNNLYIDFKEEVLESLKKKRDIFKVFTKVNEKTNRAYQWIVQNMELSLYEEHILKNCYPLYDNLKEYIIIESLKILYLLKSRAKDIIEEFERKNKNLILVGLNFGYELDKILKLVLDKANEVLKNLDMIESREEFRLYGALMELLIMNESLKPRELKELKERYRYTDINYIIEIIQEIEQEENRKRVMVIIKNILEMVFNRRQMHEIILLKLKREVVEMFRKENELGEKVSVLDDNWKARFLKNSYINRFGGGIESEVLNRKKGKISILSINDINFMMIKR